MPAPLLEELLDEEELLEEELLLDEEELDELLDEDELEELEELLDEEELDELLDEDELEELLDEEDELLLLDEDELEELLDELEPPIGRPPTRNVQVCWTPAILMVQFASLDASKLPSAVKPKLTVWPTAMLPLNDALVKV